MYEIPKVIIFLSFILPDRVKGIVLFTSGRLNLAESSSLSGLLMV